MHSHLLAPLPALVSPKVKFKWHKEHQDAFDQFKTLISKEHFIYTLMQASINLVQSLCKMINQKQFIAVS
jgi:hypothetical protein